MWKWILAAVLTPSLAFAQAQEERIVPGGTSRLIMENSRQVVQAGADTTRGVFVSGADQWSYYMKSTATNDSIGVKVYLDLSPDNVTFVAWSTGAMDSTFVARSGGSTSTHYALFTNPPNYSMYARLRMVGAMAAGDTANVTIKWVLTWLPVVFNPP